MTLFFDFEASGLSPESYPIEIGWARVTPSREIVSGGSLIRPASHWRYWSEVAEGMHRIPRAELIAAPTILDVLDQIGPLFGAGPCLCDGGSWDRFWADRLYEFAGTTRPWKIGDAEAAVLCLPNLTDHDVEALKKSFRAARPHRAEADARLMAECYLRALEVDAMRCVSVN